MRKLVEIQVVLSVTTPGNWMSQTTRDGNLRKSAEALANEVKKHCDYYEDHTINHVYECEFCGHQWEDWSAWPYKDEPDAPLGMPRCCEKAAQEWRESQVPTPQTLNGKEEI